jgi:glyoxylase-like metal-dependent hydrolase (beta-lactamase superfamily II)
MRAAMDGEQLADGVYGFEDKIVNWYLIADGTRLTVVDAGFPSAWKQLERWLDRNGRKKSDVEAVILTHGHVDHIGFAERARHECGARVWVHPEDAPIIEKPSAIAESERSPLLYSRYMATNKLVFDALRTGAFRAKSVRSHSAFTGDGETLVRVPGSPRVFYAPGHTRGHVLFQLPDQGVVFAGDAVVARDPYTGKEGPRMVARAATWNTDINTKSLDVLEQLDGELVLTGHGRPLKMSPADAAKKARANGSA